MPPLFQRIIASLAALGMLLAGIACSCAGAVPCSMTNRQDVATEIMPCCANHGGLMHRCGMHHDHKPPVPVRGDCTHCGQSLLNDSSTTPQSAFGPCATLVPFTAIASDPTPWGVTTGTAFASPLYRISSPSPIAHSTLLNLHCALIR